MESLVERVKVELKDSVARVIFYSNKSNSLSSKLLKKISTELKKLNKNKNCGLIILESEGDSVFCAGASLKEIENCKTKKQAEAIFLGFAELINCLRKSEKFVICKVQGKALGGAIGLIAAADYVLAIDSALVKLPELSVGIGPYAISAAVERKIGLAAFSEMSLDCEWKDAKWCQQKGLFNKVFSSSAELEKGLQQLSAHLISLNQNATKEMRKLLWKGSENWDSLLKARAKISAKLLLQKKKSN